ncbi:MAG: tRNA (adenosine(37)-N6)-dimethylallyltransferase MiaA [Patescibacteria group bacterium]|nr:tRNA (adenosine(37)-N6)-dimethylallyltransferase MiaA [Patescibacteria group bacterium]
MNISIKANKLIVVLGPTASGKTETAIRLAKKFNGEIVSADSRQIYKELNIGTAKPDIKNSKTKNKKRLFKKIPYHLIDVVRPDKEFNVAIYKKIAIKQIKEIQKRGKIPFLVGGTGLYIWTIVNNVNFPRVKANKKLREELEKKSCEELFKIYKKLDSRDAERVEKKNKRRLIRAIEVCKTTKKLFSKQRKKGKKLFDILEIGIKLEDEKLKQRISKRTKKMFKLGLETEVKNLNKKYSFNLPILRETIGYKEWENYFKGEIDKKSVLEQINIHTIQLAKKQMTWFKRDKQIQWLKNCQDAEKLVKNFLKK